MGEAYAAIYGNFPKADLHYKRAANKGNINAIYNLAKLIYDTHAFDRLPVSESSMLFRVIDTPNYRAIPAGTADDAFELGEKGANKGDARCQNLLSDCYWNAVGTLRM